MLDARLKGSQILAYYEPILKAQGKTMFDFSKHAGIKLPTFSWWKTHEDLSPKLDIVYEMAVYAGISMNEIVGVEDAYVPDDVRAMERMLVEIPEKERKMISMIIKNYFDVAKEEAEEAERNAEKEAIEAESNSENNPEV